MLLADFAGIVSGGGDGRLGLSCRDGVSNSVTRRNRCGAEDSARCQKEKSPSLQVASTFAFEELS